MASPQSKGFGCVCVFFYTKQLLSNQVSQHKQRQQQQQQHKLSQSHYIGLQTGRTDKKQTTSMSKNILFLNIETEDLFQKYFMRLFIVMLKIIKFL